MTNDDSNLEPLTPKEGVERFFQHYKPGVRKSTFGNAQTRLGHFLDWCEEDDVDELNELTGRDLADFVAWRREQVKPITVRKQLSTIRMALEYWAKIEAVEKGLREKVHAPELPDGADIRSEKLEPERAKRILDHLDRYQYASRRHAIMAILWRTAMRRSTLRGLDVDDLEPDHEALVIKHRPETGTPLKNGEGGERWVYLGPKWFQIVYDYVNNPERDNVVDEHGREPLITSQYGRPTGDTIYKWVSQATQPCEYGECPHDRDPQTCEARGDGYPSKCPSSRSPHPIRRGAITYSLNNDKSAEYVSQRADVSLEVLYKHYDARTPREKMEVRKKHFMDE